MQTVQNSIKKKKYFIYLKKHVTERNKLLPYFELCEKVSFSLCLERYTI